MMFIRITKYLQPNKTLKANTTDIIQLKIGNNRNWTDKDTRKKKLDEKKSRCKNFRKAATEKNG